MQQQSNRKELVSVSLDKTDTAILRCHAAQNYRSLSEIIRLVCKDYIDKSNLKQRYPQQIKGETR